MFESIIALVFGFILLIWSADEFTENGAKIANIFKISPLIIGLLIFGFGTSAPEMLVSGLAAYEGHPELSIGNAFGSNIFNIALVLGITAIILPIKVKQDILKKEWLYLMASTLIAGILIWDGHLSLADGLILLGLLTLFLIYTFVAAKKGDHKEFNNLAIAINTGTNLPSVATPNGQAAFLFLLTSSLAPLINLSYLRMVYMALPYTIVLSVVGYVAINIFL